MAEPQTEIEYVTPKVSPETSSGMKAALVEGHRLFDSIAAKGEDIKLNSLLKKVYDWENAFGDKVAENEIEALHAISLMLGTVEHYINHADRDPKSARLQSVETQRDFLQMMFTNIGKDGKPTEGISRTFGLITNVFDKFFVKDILIADAKSVVEAGLWQGTMGMVTAGFLFKEAGWKVAFAAPELDVSCDCDFLAENPQGQVFSVDVTAKGAQYDNDGERIYPFRVSHDKAPREVTQKYAQVTGKIKINVPPIWHSEADNFYADRRSGFPRPESVEKFKKQVEM